MPYDYKYTEKDVSNVEKLNFYELQHALYSAYAEFDEEATREAGRNKIEAIYREYERRGFNNIVNAYRGT